MTGCFLGNILSFVLPVWEYYSAVCMVFGCRYTRVVSGASFLTVGVFQYDIAHRRSVAVLCILYKIWCNHMHTLCGALPEPYVPMQVDSGSICGTILLTIYSMVWDWRVLRVLSMPFYWPKHAARSLFVFYCFPFANRSHSLALAAVFYNNNNS